MLEGVSLYWRYFVCLTRPLIYPLLAQLFGIVLWIVLTYESTDLPTRLFPNVNLWILWGFFLMANLPGMFLFLDGFWKYMIWMSGLNLVTRELVETGGCQDFNAYAERIQNRSSEFSLIWLVLFAVVFIPFGLAVVPLAIAGVNPAWTWISLAIGALILFVGLLIACTLLIFYSLVFQVFAFTPGTAGASLFRSMDLVGKDIVKSLIIIAASVGITQFILPSVVMVALDIAYITPGLSYLCGVALNDVLHQGLRDLMRMQDEYPFVITFYRFLSAHPAALATEIVRSLLFTFISALLLPLGTCWFALLYADLRVRMDAERARQNAIELEASLP